MGAVDEGATGSVYLWSRYVVDNGGLRRRRLASDAVAIAKPGYASCMKRWRTFLERLPGGHRPPTGPLTTAEATAAEELQHERPAEDTHEASEDSDREAPPGPDG